MAPTKIIEIDENTLKTLNPAVYTLRDDLVNQPETSAISQSPFQLATRENYLRTQKLAKSKFGKNSRAYKTIMYGINCEGATGSQLLFDNLMGVIGFEDLEEIHSSGKEGLFKEGLYYGLIDLILRTGEAEDSNNQPLLDNLIKQVYKRKLKFSEKNPLRIQGLGLIADKNKENEYGLLLKINDNTRIIKDKRFAYGRDEIKLGNKIIPIYTRTPGVSRVYLSRNGDLDAGYDDLAGSDGNGRVVLAKSRSD